jgi:hypothetical protein
LSLKVYKRFLIGIFGIANKDFIQFYQHLTNHVRAELADRLHVGFLGTFARPPSCKADDERLVLININLRRTPHRLSGNGKSSHTFFPSQTPAPSSSSTLCRTVGYAYVHV